MSWVGDVEARAKAIEADPERELNIEAAILMEMRPSLFMEWDIWDRTEILGKMLLDRRRKAETCSSCGSKPSDWLDENGRTISPPPYVVDWETCKGCDAIEKAKGTYGDKADSSTRPFLKPNTEA